MKAKSLILCVLILSTSIHSAFAVKKAEKSDREVWCEVAYHMAAPVLSNFILLHFPPL